MTRIPRLFAMCVAAALLLSACDGDAPPRRRAESSPTPSPEPKASPSATFPPPALDSVAIKATPVADVDDAVAMAFRKGDDALYVAGRHDGRITLVRGGAADPNPVLDLSEEISTAPEQGLLGIV